MITAGFPCQDLSVAGKRGGLAGKRSGLFFEIVRIIREMREATDGAFPSYLVLENVPGLLSSNGGRDFAVVLGELAGVGAVDIAWRVLDAQFFGLAQRRQRVFLVASFRADTSAAQVLFEPESGGGHPPPRRETGQGTARGAAYSVAVRGRTDGQEWELGAPEIGNALRAGDGGSSRGNWAVVPSVAHSLRAQGQLAHREDIDTLIPAVAHTLRAEGFDAGEDGTGRGTSLVPIAFSSKDSGHDATTDLAPTMRSMNFDRSHINGGGQLAVAFNWQNAGNAGYAFTEDATGPLDTSQTKAIYAPGLAVRRLTPTECERLQGFPDGWTAEGADGKPLSDSARYRCLGNAVAVPVAQWIGERIARLA